MKLYKKTFDSIHQVNAWIDATPAAGYFREKTLYSAEGSAAFCGTTSLEEARELSAAGWLEGANKIKACQTESLMGAITAARSIFAVTGSIPSVARYLANNPKSMRKRIKQSTPAPVADIVYDVAAGCNESVDDIQHTSAKLLNVIVGLERAGIRCGLQAAIIARSKSKKEVASMCVRIKQDFQPLNIAQCAYTLAHPSFLRRHFFAALERIGVKDNWGDYGNVIPSEEAARLARREINPRAVVLSYYDIKQASERDIINKIKNQLNNTKP